MREDKLWGWVDHSESFGIPTDLIHVVPGGYCSIHYHERKSNLFIVRQGILRVIRYARTQWGEIAIEDYHDLSPSDIINVEPMRLHMFFALTECEAVEMYLGDTVDPDDIVRLEEGGRVQLHDSRCPGQRASLRVQAHVADMGEAQA